MMSECAECVDKSSLKYKYIKLYVDHIVEKKNNFMKWAGFDEEYDNWIDAEFNKSKDPYIHAFQESFEGCLFTTVIRDFIRDVHGDEFVEDIKLIVDTKYFNVKEHITSFVNDYVLTDEDARNDFLHCKYIISNVLNKYAKKNKVSPYIAQMIKNYYVMSRLTQQVGKMKLEKDVKVVDSMKTQQDDYIRGFKDGYRDGYRDGCAENK